MQATESTSNQFAAADSDLVFLWNTTLFIEILSVVTSICNNTGLVASYDKLTLLALNPYKTLCYRQ